MKISIIVPVYNTSEYLKECLNSLVDQTIQDYEVIVIDDGSTDDSLKIIKEYYEHYPKIIKYKSIKNSGVSHARNVGLSMAKGEYVGFVDSDDYIDKDMYLKLYNKAKEEKAEIALCGYYKLKNKKLEPAKIKENKEFENSVKNNPKILKYSSPFAAVHLFKKKLIDNNKIIFEDYKIFEDLLFTYKAYKHANKIVKVFEPLYYYRIRDNGSSATQGFSKNYTQLFTIMNELKEYYGDYIPQEYLTYIALKHIFIRFRTKTTLKQFVTKYKFVNKAFKFLNSFDSNWKNNSYFDRHRKSKHFYTLYWVIIPMKVGTTK